MGYTHEGVDVLGAPYERLRVDLGRDDEGPVIATVVRRPADVPGTAAVLFIHGLADYFFHAHVADELAAAGRAVYGIDLRKYGRSLLTHQTPNFCRDLSDYFPDLDAAVAIMRADGARTILVSGHSAGGLLAAYWAHHRPGLVDGLFLNSPFFDLPAPWLVRRPLAATVTTLARSRPYLVLPRRPSTLFGDSAHATRRGEWAYDLAWKPLAGFPIRAGWIAATHRAQRELRRGLDLPMPVLVGRCAASYRGRAWHDDVTATDIVLDVDHIARWAPNLGRHVTVATFPGGMHDLTLSRPPVRRRVLDELLRWSAAFLPAAQRAAATG
jgi:alpha-beta hydrolase superfamily lysophospholipase